MISALIVIMGIVTVFVTSEEDPGVGLIAIFLCAIIAAVLGIFEIPLLLALISKILC